MPDIAETTTNPGEHPEPQPQPKLSRSEQARINGAKSRGPQTLAGKGRACMNALKHGRFAKLTSPLEIEDGSAYIEMEQRYLDRFQPADIVEQKLVCDLASIDWRLTRCVAIETRTLDLQLRMETPTGRFDTFQLSRLATAVKKLVAGSPVLDSLTRQETALIRNRQIVLDTLLKLRRNQPRPDRTQILSYDWYIDPETIPESNPAQLEANQETNRNEPAPLATTPPC